MEELSNATQLFICGAQVEVSRSGKGQSWQSIRAMDLSYEVYDEIEWKILFQNLEECDEFLASDGLHYRWKVSREN